MMMMMAMYVTFAFLPTEFSGDRSLFAGFWSVRIMILPLRLDTIWMLRLLRCLT